MTKANPSSPGRGSINTPTLIPNPPKGEVKQVKRDGGVYDVQELSNGDVVSTRVDVDPKHLRKTRTRS